MDTFFRRWLILGLFASFGMAPLFAQQAIGLRVTALTSAERDAFKRDLPAASGMHVVFACVPAGVLVVSSDERGASRPELRSRIIALLSNSIPHDRIGTEDLTLEAAENTCANARNQ